jgi:transposase
MYWGGRRCRKSSISDVTKVCRLDWKTVKDLEKEYMKEQLEKALEISPRSIGIDEISVKKGHVFRIVVSDLDRKVSIWFRDIDRSKASMNLFMVIRL